MPGSMAAMVAVETSKNFIIEEFIKVRQLNNLLTVTQKNGPTLFCPPISHVQKVGTIVKLPACPY